MMLTDLPPLLAAFAGAWRQLFHEHPVLITLLYTAGLFWIISRL